MKTLLERLRHRLLPAALAAIGVSLLAAGLLTYLDPVAATLPASQAPAIDTASPAPTALLTLPPLPSPSPDGSATSRIPALATRVVVSALGIDLPVIQQPGGPNAFPPCNVAMYLQELHQPGQPGATYLYAHARTGMFLPILTASQINNGQAMLGMLVQVYTSDDQLYLYEVTEVRRHVTTLDAAFAEQAETVWLQTSEGPKLPDNQIGPKVQLIARPLSHGPADHTQANPKAAPVFCQ